MAVQIPDPGTGNGQTGDNEYVFRKKVKHNFSDSTNAASRLVGTANGQVPLAEQVPSLLGTAATKDVGTAAGNVMVKGAFGLGAANFFASPNESLVENNEFRRFDPSITGLTTPTTGVSFSWAGGGAGRMVTAISSAQNGGAFYTHRWTQATVALTNMIYTTGNTTKDANGFLKAASPIVKVHADKVVLNQESEQQNVTFKKNGIGDYTITTQSGLSTDGWYIELPKDMNGNPKVAVTLQETNGVISLKSYKRIFSMETFTFVPDLDEPMDVPDGRWIDLRLNEIPSDDPQPDEV